MESLQEHLTTLLTEIKRSNPTLTTISELEFRLGDMANGAGNFRSYVPVEVFHTIIDSFKAKHHPDVQSILTVSPGDDDLKDARVRIQDIKKIQYFCVSDKFDPDTTEISNKVSYRKHNVPELGCRISAASEEAITDDDTIKSLQQTLRSGRDNLTSSTKHYYRYMKRYEFEISDDIVLDLSVVKASKGNNFRSSKVLAQAEHYEVELEYKNVTLTDDPANDARVIYEKLQPFLDQLLRESMGGMNIAPMAARNKARTDYTILIDGDSKEPASFAGASVITMTHSDMIDTDESPAKVTADCIFTDKADGERHLLFFDSGGDGYLIDHKLNPFKPIGFRSTHTNTLFDGELLRVNSKYYFLAFDLLFLDGIDIRKTDFYNSNELSQTLQRVRGLKNPGTPSATRYGKMHQFEMIDIPLFRLCVKDFFKLPNLYRIGSISGTGDKLVKTYYINDTDSIPYTIDGLIIQHATGEPSYYPVLTNRSKYRAWETSLKWKPVSMITVDFCVNLTQKTVKASSTPWREVTTDKNFVEVTLKYMITRDKMVEYKRQNGDTKWYFPAGEDGTARTKEKDRVIKNNDIVECAWDLEVGHWYPLRVRYDKSVPNAYRTVECNVSLISNPILFDDLKDLEKLVYWVGGSVFIVSNMQKFHSSLKYTILETYYKSLGTKSRSLLDLGAGHANDVHKWNRLQIPEVVGIETDRVAIEQGKLRVRNSKGAKTNVTLERGDFTKPLDTISAINKKFGMVTCFFAIHYACGTELTFRNLMYNVSKRLEKNGYFIGTTFDRSALLKLIPSVVSHVSTDIISDAETDVKYTITNNIHKFTARRRNAAQSNGTKMDLTMWEIEFADNQDDKSLFGFEINVFVNSIGKTHREFVTIIGDDRIQEIVAQYGLQLEKSDMFNAGDSMSAAERLFSNLNTTFVFKKIIDVEIDQLKKITNIVDVKNTQSGNLTLKKQAGTTVSKTARPTKTRKPPTGTTAAAAPVVVLAAPAPPAVPAVPVVVPGKPMPSSGHRLVIKKR